MSVRPFLSFLFILTAAFLAFPANPSKVFAAHGEGSSWVENSNLAGCEHCHDTWVEWDTGEARLIANRDEIISVRGGRSAQTHMIVNMMLDSGRTTPCDPGVNCNHDLPSLWSDVVNFMTEKEPLPLPFDELNVKTYLINCYDNVAGSSYNGCPTGPGTVDDNCNCGPPETTTSTTSTTTSTTTSSSTTIAPTSTTTSTSSSTTSTSITIGTSSTSTTVVTSSTTTTSSTTLPTTTSTTLVFPNSDLGISITATPNPVVYGDLLTYTMTAINNGPEAVSGTVSVSNSLTVIPESITSSKGSCGIRVIDSRSGATYSSSCSFSGMGVGETVDVELVVVAISSTASITVGVNSFGINDPNPANNSASLTVPKDCSGLSLRAQIRCSISFDRPDPPPRPTVIRPVRPQVR